MDQDTDYVMFNWDEKPKEVKQEANSCPKCGKLLGKGGPIHVKYCNGPKGKTQ